MKLMVSMAEKASIALVNASTFGQYIERELLRDHLYFLNV